MYRNGVYHEFTVFGRYFASLRVRKAPRQLQGFVAAQPGGACGKAGTESEDGRFLFFFKKISCFSLKTEKKACFSWFDLL